MFAVHHIAKMFRMKLWNNIDDFKHASGRHPKTSFSFFMSILVDFNLFVFREVFDVF